MKRPLLRSRLMINCPAIFFLALVAVFVVIADASRAMAQPVSEADLEQAAKREGKIRIVVYPSYRPVVKGFEEKYGIKVEGIYVDEPNIQRRVSTESEAGVFQIDLFTTTTGPIGSILNKRALPYTPKGFEKVADVKKMLPAGWNQTPLVRNVVGVAYNKELVPPHQVPKSIYDLLKPEFKGKIISRTPWLGSNWIVHILSYYTWFNEDMNSWRDYWSRLKANVGRFESGFVQLHTAVGLKEFPMGVYSLQYATKVWGGSYPALAYSTFKEGGIWWPNMAVVHAKAPRPNAAKLFTNFLISDEGQRLFAKEGLIPANKNIPPSDEIKEALEGTTLLGGQAHIILVRETVEREEEWKDRIQKVYQ